MFVYALGDKYKSKGIPLDAIGPEMRNRFVFLSKEEGTRNCLQIRLSEKAIRFFYYDRAENKAEDVVIEKHYKEVASVSLTNRKEAGQDILYLKKQVDAKSHELESLDPEDAVNWELVCKNLVDFHAADGKTALDNFPFVKHWNWEQTDKKAWFAFFIQCCFLDFVAGIEDRESCFSVSPYYDEVRNKLRECKVYQLLTAKMKYVTYLYHGAEAISKDEYTFKTQRFADLLMDANINKVIPSYYYFDNLWFYNPEIELDLILRKNYETRINKGGARLDSKIQDKIRDFFFQRHAVVSAMGSKWAKCLYGVYIFVIGLFSVCTTYCMIRFDKVDDRLVMFYFDHIVLWDIIGMGSLVCLIILSVTRSVNVFMPRVLVALGIGWLTAFVSEDLIKSQLEIGSLFTTISCVGVLALILVMLFGETRQHSPYYIVGCKGIGIRVVQIWKFSSSWKLLPILFHSYFWALTLGTVMQFAVYDDLLKNSQALKEVVFEDDFGTARDYVMHLTYLKEALADYQRDMEGFYIKADMSGVVKGPSVASFMAAKTSYDPTEYTKIRECSLAKLQHIDEKYNKVDSIVKQMIVDNSGHNFVSSNNHGDGYLNWFVFGKKPYKEIDMGKKQMALLVKSICEETAPAAFDSLIGLQLRFLDTIVAATEEEIQSVRVFVSENDNHASLVKWSYQRSPKLEGPWSMPQLMIIKASRNHNLCRKVRMWWIPNNSSIIVEKILFPRMLIFHSLIVLIIAFVGQLIVSDKSVTEPL